MNLRNLLILIGIGVWPGGVAADTPAPSPFSSDTLGNATTGSPTMSPHDENAIPAFSPLSCNSAVDTADCTNLSTLVAGAGDQLVVIPCGTCSKFDITDGSTLTVPGGINVEGRLLVDGTANGMLNTTAVIVQGKLSIREVEAGNSFTINLFGTDEVQIFPHAENGRECGVEVTDTSTVVLPCNLGKKPIAVMGGALDVDASPPGKTTCPSWVHLKSKYASTPPVADDLIPTPTNPKGITAHNSRYTSSDVVVNDMGDDEFKIEDATKNNGLRVKFKPQGSLERKNAVGKTITLSWSYKVDDGASHLGWTGRAKVRWGNYSRSKGEMWLDTTGCTVTPGADQWASCSTSFVYTSNMAGMNWNDVHIVLGSCQGCVEWTSRKGNYDFSFKDIKVENLQDIVSSPDTLEVGVKATSSNCWSVGDDILITPSGSNQNGHVLRRIIAIDSANGFITLDKGVNRLENTLLSQDEGEDGLNFAVEVASLSRNVKFTSEKDDPDPLVGGHLIVMHTPNVAQLLRGVEISNFGQQGNIGRYPIHLHVSEDVHGTSISKNVIRQSNQRCIVVHGTHKAHLYDNIAFDVIGHCFMLEDGGEWHNKFERNLGCKNRRHQVEASWTRSDIAEPALFLISNPQNYYIENVAAGSAAHGYWFELLKRVSGESSRLDINKGVNPRVLPLISGGFVGNVAHSSSQDGITTQGNAYQFQTSWTSPAGTLNVLENTKSYKNSKDGLMLNAKRMHVLRGIMADNDRCINFPLKTMGGLGNIVEGITCTAVSQHQRDKGVVCHGQFEKSNPEPGYSGITFHVNKGDNAAEILKNITFTGFNGLESCWGGKGTAIQVLIPNVLDNKRWTGPAMFDGDLVFDGPAFDIKCFTLDWSMIDSNHGKAIQNVYVHDKDGSVGSASIGTTVGSGAFFATPERDPDATAFVDQNNCTRIDYPDSCGMYCEGPCVRRIGIQNDNHREDVLMVITNGEKDHKYERNPNAIYYPRWSPDYEAILPKPASPETKYTISFINKVTQASDWPSYAKLTWGGEPGCSDFIDSANVDLVMPDIDERCSDMSLNGDFETGTSKGWNFMWFGRKILQETNNTTNSTNYYLRTHNRKLSRSSVYTFVDRSCMKKGERYHISVKIRIQGEDGTEKSCNGDCPWLSLFLTKGDETASPLQSYSLGKPSIIPGDGSWVEHTATVDLTKDIPTDAYQTLVKFRLAPRVYSSLLLDDFKMEHIGPITSAE